jgi:GT2 family glycosyltransferase
MHLPQNPGYGSAHNIAIRKSIKDSLPYHLVLNADVRFSIEVLSTLVQYLDANPNVAHVMPKVLNPDGSIQRLCKLVPTPFDLFLRRFLPEPLAIGARRRFELWNSNYDKIAFVPYLSGCFMLLRTSALEQIGLFDERFFMYPEDIDLTRRIAEQFDTHFYPYVFVVHEHGSASYKSINMMLIHSGNIIKYFNKWGWFFDKRRSMLNKKTLRQFSSSDFS